MTFKQSLTLVELEEIFRDPPGATQLDFQGFLSNLLKTPIWRSLSEGHDFYRSLCMELSQGIDEYAKDSKSEPPYHSRSHFKDVCLAISLLISQQDWENLKNEEGWWCLSTDDAWLLLLCAIGHDFAHTGAINQRPFEIESLSLRKIRDLFIASGHSQERVNGVMAAMEPIVLATDPTRFGDLVDIDTRTVKASSHQAHLSILLIEADLMASILPNKGALLSKRLSDEWAMVNLQMAKVVATKLGRAQFLRKICFVSPMSQQLGLDEIRQISLGKLLAQG